MGMYCMSESFPSYLVRISQGEVGHLTLVIEVRLKVQKLSVRLSVMLRSRHCPQHTILLILVRHSTFHNRRNSTTNYMTNLSVWVSFERLLGNKFMF